MSISLQALYLSATTQLLLTVCLVTLLWALYTRLQRYEFFRWWAWAWTALAIFLLSATISLHIGPLWTARKSGLVLALLLAGYLQPVLLVFGGLSWRSTEKLPRRWFWGGAGLAVAVALLSFAASFSTRHVPVLSFAIRNVPRTFLMASALLFCCLVFWREFRRSGAHAAAITGVFCLSYAVNQLLYFLSFSDMLGPYWGFHLTAKLHALAKLDDLNLLLFLDLVDTCGICLGMILLLVERYQHTATELEVSEQKRLGLAVNNVSLQVEIQRRQKVEEELRQSESRYRDLVEHSEDVLGTHRLDGQILTMNEAPCRRLGYTVEEVLKMKIQDLLAPRYRNLYTKFVERVLETGHATGLMVVTTRSGEERVWDYTSTLRKDGVAEPVIRGMAHDVTERHRAEQAVRLSEAKFATAFRASPHAMTITSLKDGRFIDVNASFERQSGYTREEVLGKTILDIRLWADSPDFASVMEDSLKRQKVTGREVRLRTKGGRIVHAIYSVEVIHIDGEPCALAAGEDITERLEIERALRESEHKFRLVADTVNSAIWLLQDYRFVYFNKEFERITGYSREEILAMDPWDLVEPEFRAESLARAQARLAGEPVPSRYQFAIATKSGEKRWIDFSAARTEFNGRPAILASALDITAGRRAERELKEHAMYMDALISNVPLGVVIKDEQQRVRFCNPAFEHMFQYAQAEIQGKNLDDLIAPHDWQEARQLSEAVQDGGVVHTTARRRRKDGTFIDVELYGVKVFSGKSFLGAFAIYQDITERRKSEEKLVTLRSRLSRAQEEERARIARDLHDDTGQRLALLSIDLEQLKQVSMQLKSSLTDQLEALVKAASEITSDVHNVSRRLHPSQVELLGLPVALSNFCKDFAARNGMEIVFVNSCLRQKTPQDAALCLFRVAQEAVRNVQKHSGIQRALVQLDEVAGSMRLRVSDQGAGFDPDSSDFVQGLGLLSMQERLHSLGGELFIHSRPGRGTCIEACIPLSATVSSEQ
jgi:PAS domain S-box-containing protein